MYENHYNSWYNKNFTNAAESTGVNVNIITPQQDFIKSIKKYPQGGPTYAELTDDEIARYRAGGWVIEELE